MVTSELFENCKVELKSTEVILKGGGNPADSQLITKAPEFCSPTDRQTSNFKARGDDGHANEQTSNPPI